MGIPYFPIYDTNQHYTAKDDTIWLIKKIIDSKMEVNIHIESLWLSGYHQE